jgi:hypothetical protein
MQNMFNMQCMSNVHQCAEICIMCHKRLIWYIKSSTWLCVLSSWYLMSREMADPRPSCHPRVQSLALSSVSQPPQWKTRGGLRGRRTRRAWDVSWRAASAHGTRRRVLRRARRRRQWRGIPPRSRRKGYPYCRRFRRRRCPRSSAHELRRWARRRRRRRGGRGRRGSRAWVECCHTCGRVLGASSTTSANPARERRRDQGGGGEEGDKAFTLSFIRAVGSACGLLLHAWATGRAPAGVENRARALTRHRAAAPGCRAAHSFLAHIVHQHTSTRQWKKEERLPKDK